MMTSIPAAASAIVIASSGSPQLNPPTVVSICAWVRHSVSVTTRACGNPAGWPFDRSAERGLERPQPTARPVPGTGFPRPVAPGAFAPE
jgi:hypothetical protein